MMRTSTERNPMGDASAHRRHDQIVDRRFPGFTPLQLKVIRALVSTRMRDLINGDKRPELIRKEIEELMPEYRAILQRIDDLR